MKTFKEISASSFEQFEVLYWNKQAIHQFYPRIDSYVSIRLGNAFKGLFAQPKIIVQDGQKTAVSWRMLQSDDEAVISLKDLKLSNDASVQQIEKQLSKLNQFVKTLKTSTDEEDKDWGSLLELCIENITEDTILLIQGNMVITGWGIKEIRTPNKFTFPLIEEDEVPNEPVKENLPLENKEVSIEEAENDNNIIEEEPILEELPLSNNEITEDNTEQEKIQTQESTENIIEEQKRDEPINDGGNNVPPKKSNRSNFFGKFNYWWLILLFLLLLLIFWRACNFQTQESYLPSNPNVIVPIDTNNIVSDDDNLRKIVSDRINIILKDKNQDAATFAVAFKKEYKGEDYKIIYYDTLINRIQIQVPSKEREQLMKEIPQKMSNFNMLIWHESIFERNAIPSDPEFSDASKAWYLDAINARPAWDKSYGNKKVVVAIIDDGFDVQHQELAGHITRPWNVVNRNQNVFTYKKSQHGSHVAGTAVANRDNNTGLAGIAPDCMLMPIQVSDNDGIMSTTAIIDAVLYAINQGADVINLSLGMVVDPRVANYPIGVQKDIIKNSFLQEEAFWNEVLLFAEENNVVVVMAAGNQNVLVGLDPMQRSPLAIKVSAIGHNIQKAAFSNFGDKSTVSAPGTAIYSSVPSNRYAYMDGTSMAAPIVAGAVALLRSIKPDLKPNEVRNLLVNTGLPISPKMGPLIQLGTAVEMINDDNATSNPDDIDCDKIQKTIDSLLQVVEQLQRLCPDGYVRDTMKMPDVIKDLDFSLGRWKSTTSIHNDEGEEVTLYFDFLKNKKGILTLVEPDGINCTADLSLKTNAKQLKVNQIQEAQCKGENKTYQDYTFSCQADANGYAECTAQNKKVKANKFNFKLIKIR
jgi:subtilisin family serine protease